MSSSDSDSGSDSSSSSSSSESSGQQKDAAADEKARQIPPIIQRKLQLRNQLDMYQVDEEFEEEKYTVTGKTATDVVLPNIREIRVGRH